MSPEQVKGEEIDWRTDVYSLGAVLYHLLTSKRPFTGGTTYELIEAILNSTPPPPSELRPDSPAGLDDVVGRAMGKLREARYSSWEEFGDALAGLAKGGKPAATCSTPRNSAPRAASSSSSASPTSNCGKWCAPRSGSSTARATS